MQNVTDDARVRGMTRSEAAEYISQRWFKQSPKTLAKLAVVGGGPAYRKAGRIPIYTADSCDEYARKKISPLVRSTSELRAAAQ